VDDATKFVIGAYAHLVLYVPPKGQDVSPNQKLSFTLRVKGLMTANTPNSPACGDSLILDGRELHDSGWVGADHVQSIGDGAIQNLDSVTYRISGDTLLLKRNTLDEGPFALGVETFRLQYFHPVAGWGDSLSGVAPANAIQKVRIRLVLRTRTVDQKLARSDSSSRGYRFSKMETEVGIRAAQLSNK